jgi:hypothetical protein
MRVPSSSLGLPLLRSKGLLPELGLPNVFVERAGRLAADEPLWPGSDPAKISDRALGELFPASEPPRILPATVDGDLAGVLGGRLTLALPQYNLRVIADQGPAPAGRVQAIVDDGGRPQTLAACYRLGQGRLIVIADPRLVRNQYLAKADNAVLACRLAADFGQPVIFNEFFHGLNVRGNPLWLVSRFPYGLLAGTLLGSTLILAWRAARFLGPPIPTPAASRRTLAEYIEAMARLLNRSRRSGRYVLNEIRHGLLWRARHDLGLPPGPDECDDVLRALARRSPERADRFREAIASIDEALRTPSGSPNVSESTFQKVSACVPRSALQRRSPGD